MFLNHVFGDGRGGTIQPLAKLLLQQPEQQREKLVGFVFRRELFQIVQAVEDERGHGALAAQARIVGQAVRPFAPDEGGEKRQHRQALRREKNRLRDERNFVLRKRSEIFLDGQ